MTARHIAVLIDGGYFLRRLPRLVSPGKCDTPEHIVGCIRHLCHNHVRSLTKCEPKDWSRHLYRIFYYDAKPYDGKAHHPIDNRPIDFAKSDLAQQRHAIFDCLRKQRKVALRLGKVNREHDWAIDPTLTKKLLRTRQLLGALARLPEADAGPMSLDLSVAEQADLWHVRDLWTSLDGGTVALGLRQKGVDMRIGVDIASLALKRQVDTIVLVAGDSDFVPAAKLARREGIDFILDPLWQKINADLFEHIDGLHSGLSRPGHPQSPEQRLHRANMAAEAQDRRHLH
jgi:uncharacterized LabA/DUF88 family protein